jgi:hypothetical protein
LLRSIRQDHNKQSSDMVVGILVYYVTFLIARCCASDISIGQDLELQSERDCVRACVAGGIWIPRGGCWLGCELGWDSSECYCREDLRPEASSILSSCIYTGFTTCADAYDYNAAVSIYDRYCTFTAPATVTATATQSAEPSPSNEPVTVTVTSSTPTETVFVSSQATRTSPSSQSEWFAVAILAGILGFACLLVPWHR